MATRANTSVVKKETKKTTPLSNSRSKQTNNVVGAAASVANKVKTTTTPSPSAKPVPNYLRHTTSSSKSDILTPTKKKINEDLSHNVDRRRSFDRPPSAIRNHKSLISPDPRDRVLSRERQLATRSSSFSPSSSSSKVPSSPKPILERNAKSLRPIRPQPTSSVRRSSSFSKTTNSLKNGSGIASSHSTKSSTNGNVEESNQELEIKDQSFVQEANNGETEDVHMQKDEIKDDTVVDFVQGSENIKDGTTTEEDGEAIGTFLKLKLIEGSSETLDENHENEQEINHTHEEDNKMSDQEKEEEESSNINAIEQPEEERIADDAPEIETEEDHKLEEDEEKKEEESDIIVESKDDQLEEIEVKVELKESSSFNGGRQGKRESPAAYNDVIEETKNKLLEKRKNKVKALVGAFETVIDYETAGVNK